MKIHNTIYLPEGIFESASKQNYDEALSERLAKAFLTKILKVPGNEIIRGNPSKDEPDYLCNGQGFEVTFCMKPETILQMKGKKPIDGKPINIEQQMTTYIRDAADRKSKKHYSVNTTLFLLNLLPNNVWDWNVPLIEVPTLENQIDYHFSHYWNEKQKTRNQLFKSLYKNYIVNKKFDDILLASVTNERTYIIYSIKDFSNGKKFYYYIGINDNPNIPYCVITNVGKYEVFSPFENLYTVIYAKRN